MSHDPEIYKNQQAYTFKGEDLQKLYKLDVDRYAEKIATMTHNKWTEFNKIAITIGGYAATNSLSVTQHEALDTLIAAANSNGNVLDYKEAERQIKNGFDFGMTKPLEIERRFMPELRPQVKKKNEFPVDVFPDFFQDYINHHVYIDGFSKDFMACSLIFTISTILGNKIKMQEKWDTTPIFWFACVGDAGSNKTHPVSNLIKPMRQIDSERLSDYRKEMSQYLKDFGEWKGSKDKNKGEPPEKPTAKQRIVNDATVEAIIQVHSYNTNGLGMYMDEMAAFYGAMNQYKGGKGTDEAFWLSSFNNGSHIVNRKNAEPISVDNLFVNIIGTIQPEVLKDVAMGTKDSGLADRFLYTEVFSEIETIKPEIADPRFAEAYTEFIFEMSLKMEAIQESKRLGMSKDDFCLLIKYHNKLQDLKRHEDTPVEMINYLSKLRTYMGRFVLILAVIDGLLENKEIVIETKHIENAKKIIDYFYLSACRMFAGANKSIELNKVLKNSGAITKVEKATVLIKAGETDRKTIMNKVGMSKGQLSKLIKKLS